MSLAALTQKVNLAATAMGAYTGGDALVALCEWLDAALALYREELVNITPEGLLALQAQVRQLEALKALARGAVQTNGCI